MIVSLQNNELEYGQLFTELSQEEAIKTAGLTVTDLPTYFKALEMIRGQGKYKYIRVPVDETPFHVDCNTRIITVPAEFKANGLSVKGDHTAEVVFFDVDRFFDAMDLSSCQEANHGECYIQWENAAKEVGLSRAYAFDITETKVIFGWIISDSITAAEGDVKFSVRFVKKDPDTGVINYSLSTLTAVCPIKPSLDMNVIATQKEDLSDLVDKRPIYSGIVNTADGAKPQITADIASVADLDATSKEVVLSLTAKSPDGGTIVYRWFKMDKEIVGQTTASYTANIAGTYYALVGNKKPSGTRYIQSNSCTVPAATPISITQDLPERGYVSDTQDAYKTVMTVDIGGENGELKYSWFVQDSLNDVAPTVIPSATSYSYAPAESAVDADGKYYYCHVENHRNNTHTVAESTICYIHPLPVAPASVSIAKSIDKLSLICTALPAIAASDKGAIYEYKWYCEGFNLSGVTDKPIYTLTEKDREGNKTFYCRVKQVVYPDGGTLRTESDTIYSDRLIYTNP